MTTATSTRTITRAHTAVQLSSAISGAIAEILTHVGISARSLMVDWARSYDPAIRAWIEEGSLSQVVVECHRPDGQVEPIFEFPIDYTDGSGSLSNRHVAFARQVAKFTSVPSGTTCTIICQYRYTPRDMHGWSNTTRASTVGLRSRNLGTLATGPHASASIRGYTA
jgi:hypothetical protein